MQRGGCLGVADDDAVVLARGGSRHESALDVELDERRIALERVASAAAARARNEQPIAGLHLAVVGLARQYPLEVRARVDDERGRAAGRPQEPPPSGIDRYRVCPVPRGGR